MAVTVYRPAYQVTLTKLVKRIEEGVAESYIAKVTHNITPLDGWTSDIIITRGMGFLERLRMANAPFWREGRRGPYA